MRTTRRVLLLGSLILLGCAGDKPLVSDVPQLPGQARTLRVLFVAERAGYLDTVLELDRRKLRFFFPASDAACASLMRVENTIEWKNLGPLGEMRSGEQRCDPVGIGSLPYWRDRFPRGRRDQPLPRGVARFEVVYEDDEWTLARGRFPYAGRVGWPGGWDTLALFATSEACAPLLARGEASLEFRVAGNAPLSLVRQGGSCTIEGFLQPLPSGKP